MHIHFVGFDLCAVTSIFFSCLLFGGSLILHGDFVFIWKILQYKFVLSLKNSNIIPRISARVRIPPPPSFLSLVWTIDHF